MNFCRRPLFPFAVAFIAGIICASSMISGAPALLVIMLSVAVIAYLLCLRNTSRVTSLFLVAVFGLGLLRVICHGQVSPDDVSRYAEGKQVLITGRIASDPEALGNRIRFVLACERIRICEGQYDVSGNAITTLFLSDNARFNIPCYGEVVRVRGRLRMPPFPANPGSFDYKAYLARKRIYCTLSGGIHDLSVLSGPRKDFVWMATRVRALLEGRTLALFPSVEGKLILGILLGNYALLSPEMQTAFIKSGTMHLLAASGFNCGIIVSIVGYLMYKLTIPRMVRHLLLIALLSMFAIMVGAGPSIVRATVMVSAFLIAYLLWRCPDLPNLVLFAALAILVANPLSLFDVGFQLSFVAVLAIMFVMPLVNPWIQAFFSSVVTTPQTVFSLQRWILSASRCTVTTVALSGACTIGTWPITAHYFNYVSVVSILANAIVALLVVLLTGVGLAALAVSVLSHVVAYPFSLVGKLLADLMLAVVTELGGCSWSCISVRSPSMVFMLLYYAFVLWVLGHAHKKLIPRKEPVAVHPPATGENWVGRLPLPRTLLLLIGSALLIIFVWSPFSVSKSKALYAYFLDVGQGDCILVKTPSGRAILVDGGGRANSSYSDVIGRNVVVPVLRSQGVNRIDVVVLTHPHDDHVQGLIPVLQSFHIGMVLDPALPHGSESYQRFLVAVKKRKIPYKRAVRGQTIDFGDGVRAIVLHPPEERLKEVSSYLNANSLVLRVTYGSSSLLLTGDAGIEAEDEMLSAGMNVESDVLKVAHHGSRSATSERWLDMVKPRVAIISVGRGNPFGHPSPEVLERLARRRIRVFRSDHNGAVIVRMTTRSLVVKPTFPSGKD